MQRKVDQTCEQTPHQRKRTFGHVRSLVVLLRWDIDSLFKNSIDNMNKIKDNSNDTK